MPENRTSQRTLAPLQLSWASGLALASCLLQACGFGDGEPQLALTDKQGASRSGATPTPAEGSAKPPGATNLADVEPLTPGKGPRHVILLIGDGMQLSSEVATSRYLFDRDDGLSFHSFPVQSFVTTWDVTVYDAHAARLGTPPYSPGKFDPLVGYDPDRGGEAPYPQLADSAARRKYFLDAVYPDSASTATQMSTGIKTLSASIGVPPNYPKQGTLEHASSLLSRFYGMATGFATTVQFYHATPAGFFAHSVSRNDYASIARELLTTVQPTVMIGGGFGFGEIPPSDLEQLVASNRYVYVERKSGRDGGTALLTASQQAATQGKGLFGYFGNLVQGNFEPRRPVDNPGYPLVYRGAIEDPTLADASVAALRVLSRDPDGFFLLIEQGDIDRANHSNDFARMIGCVSDLNDAVQAVESFVDEPGDAVDWTNTTVFVTADHANGYLRFTKRLGKGDLPAQVQGTYPDQEVTWGATTHTSELVSLYAKGYAADRVAAYQTPYPGRSIIDDTSVYRLILDAARR